MHVFVDTDVSQGREVPFTFVLRGAEGGVIDGLSHVISTSERGGRVILRLRILKLATTGCDDLLVRFARDIRMDTTQNRLIAQCKRGGRLVTRAKRSRRLRTNAVSTPHGMERSPRRGMYTRVSRGAVGSSTPSARWMGSSAPRG